MRDVDLLLSLWRFERCRSGRSEHTVVLLARIPALVLAWTEAAINVMVFEALDARSEQLQTGRSIAGTEHTSVGLVGPWSRAWPLSVIVVAQVVNLEVATDRCITATVFPFSLGLVSAMAREKRLCWPVELRFAVVTTRTDSGGSRLARLDSAALTHAEVPVDGASGRLLRSLWNDFVSARANLAGVVDKATHLADVT